MRVHVILYILIFFRVINGIPYVPLPQTISNETMIISALHLDKLDCRGIDQGRDSSKRIYVDQDTAKFLAFEAEGNDILVDIHFKDGSYIFDQQVGNKQTLIILPYRPVEWVFFTGVRSFTLVEYSEPSIPTIKSSECSRLSFTNPILTKLPRMLGKPTYEYFLTAYYKPEWEDVTMTTVLTYERLIRLQQMADLWEGPISAVLYVEDLDKELPLIISAWASHKNTRNYVDIHLVLNDKIPVLLKPALPYTLPINYLRNVSVKFSRTAYVMFIEADFVTNRGMYKSLGPVKEFLKKETKVALIVPAYYTEDDKYKREFDVSQFPTTKADLKKFPEIEKISKIHSSHTYTPYSDWERTDDIFQVRNLGYFYEPYYISTRDYPPFDETFLGCGRDKISHFKELEAAGYRFFVTPGGFITHLPHLETTKQKTYWCAEENPRRQDIKWSSMTDRQNRWYKSGKAPDFTRPWYLPQEATVRNQVNGQTPLPPVPPAPVCPKSDPKQSQEYKDLAQRLVSIEASEQLLLSQNKKLIEELSGQQDKLGVESKSWKSRVKALEERNYQLASETSWLILLCGVLFLGLLFCRFRMNK